MELSESERKKLVGGYSKGGDRPAPEEKDDDGEMTEAHHHAQRLIEAIHAKDAHGVAMAHKALSDCHGDIKDEEESEEE